MANIKSPEKVAALRRKVLLAAAQLFLKQGYSATTVKQIAARSGVSANAIFYEMKNKEEILAELVKYVLEGQFSATAKLLDGVTEDKILFYAAETVLQLHMAESGEQIRDLYAVAYSMPKTSSIIQHTIACKLQGFFSEHLPDLETKDFYELEIASGSIMRGFMTRPCDMYFTMERKVKRFLETTFLIYRIPRYKLEEAIRFVSGFDFERIAKQTIDTMLTFLEEKTA